jgi:putative SOS response-associated peptidase YedK
VINARAETLLEKPSFKQLVSQRRCLVPADGFYEGRREGKRKVPMWIHLKNRKPFAFAGSVIIGETPLATKSFTLLPSSPPSRTPFAADS